MENTQTEFSPSALLGPNTFVERMLPALPDDIYLLSPGDVHLGANNRSGALLEILKHTHPKILILNGDFLENSELEHHLHRLTRRDRDLIHLIEEKRVAGMRVVYIKGNHDEEVLALLSEVATLGPEERARLTMDQLDVVDTISLMRNWEIVDSLLHEYKGTKFVHVHGDQWDHIVRGGRFGRFLAYIGGFWWDILKQLDREKQYIARFVKRHIKIATHVSNRVAEGAVELAKDEGAHYAFAGHTHDPISFTVGEINYVNAGGFDMYESGIASIDTDGNVLLHHVRARSKPIKNPRLAN